MRRATWCAAFLLLAAAGVGVVLWGCNKGTASSEDLARQTVPSLMGAKALSRHYVEVTYGNSITSILLDATAYTITKPNGEKLRIESVRAGDLAQNVVLTTGGQSDELYRLDVAPTLESGQSPTQMQTASFTGSTTGSEPGLLSAISLSNTTVLLTFDSKMDPGTANNAAFYDISNPELQITAASLAADDQSLTLTTSSQENIEYTVRATNVKGGNGTFVNPEASTASFYGIPVNDTTPPRLTAAQATSATSILLSYSEPVREDAGDPTNYVVSPSLILTGAELNSYGTQVTLTSLPMSVGQLYTVTAICDGCASSKIQDLATPPNFLDPSFSSASFTWNGKLVDDLPRLVGAISTSNTTVIVSFTRPMSDSAEVASNYVVVQENQQPEAGYLGVLGAQFLDTSRMSVLLQTMSQNELTYQLTVVNLTDIDGNPLSPQELLVDPTSILFAGTPPGCPPKTCAGDSANPAGTDGNGLCESDDDCDLPEAGETSASCDAGETDCEGKCEDFCQLIDSDGDGLTDAEEQRGWEVVVELAVKRGEDGQREQTRRDVTSSPYLADTDRDGLGDALEKQLGSDPRDTDTDDDLLLDEREYNLHFTNPVDQDSDNDDIDDFLEVDYFRTSPIIADTDGDQMDDGEELFDRSRNPLIADLPLPQITVDEISLDLNITSSYTDEEGTTSSIEQSTSSTFTQSRTDTLGTSETNSTESENEFGQSIGAEGGIGVGFKVSAEATFGQSQAQGFSTTVDEESSQTSQQEYQESITTALEESESRSVTRNIDSAIVQATVNISNNSDIAFTITNIELSLLQQDRVTGLSFLPIATLRPTAAEDPTGQPVYNIGPLEQERGPIIFENTSVFPNRIDDLMREPTGLVVKVVNYDVLDEFDRNLVFTAQEVADRTAAITLDFGDGRVEVYRVATANDFDADGLPVGITMRRALEIAGITQAPLASTDVNTYATQIDTRTVDGATINVEVLVRMREVANDNAGPNANRGDKFWTAVSSNTDLDPNSDFSTIRLKPRDDILLMYTSDYDEDGLFLREEYLYGCRDDSEDTDGDGLGDYDEVRTGWTVARLPGEPYLTFPSPARSDSDLDGLEDPDEKTAGTDPNRSDTDEDGRSDPSELNDTYTILLFDGDTDITNDKVLTVAPYSDAAIIAGADGTCDTTTASGDDTVLTSSGTGSKLCIAAGPNGIIDTTPVDDDVVVAAPKIDPGPNGQCDTTTASGDDVKEFTTATAPPTMGVMGKVCFSAGADNEINTVAEGDDFVRVAHAGLFGTDPVNQDTDFDGITDGREVIIGINPNAADAGDVTDTDSDGLYDSEENDGWLLAGSTTRVYSDPNLPDTDFDGIPDVIERAIGSNPRSLDSDSDTLLDYLEFDESNPNVNGTPLYDSVVLASAFQRCTDAPSCFYDSPGAGVATGTHPALADTDGDTLDDNVECNDTGCGWTVTLYNGTSSTVYSDPKFADKDGDGLNDAAEQTNGTYPEVSDSDGDGRNDGAEITAGRNPLRQDYNMRVTLTSISVIGDCDGDTCKGLELEGSFKVRKPDQSTEVTLHTEYCKTEECCCGCIGQECCDDSKCDGGDFLSGGNDPYTDFVIQEGESFRLFTTSLRDKDTFDCTDTGYQTIGSLSEDYDFAVTPPASIVEDVGSSNDCKVRLTYTLAKLD